MTPQFASSRRMVLCIVLQGIMCACPGLAGEKKVRFERYSKEHGLSATSGRTILQDEEGFLWFGTRDGLYRFDGYRFLDFRPPGTEGTFNVNCIHVDPQGVFWLGTVGNGLNRFDPRTGEFVEYPTDPDDPDNPAAASRNSVLCMHPGKDGTLWLGTDWEGVDHFDPATEVFTNYPVPGGNGGGVIHDIHESPTQPGIIYMGTASRGLVRLDSDTKTFHLYRDKKTDAQGVAAPPSANRILEVEPGILFLRAPTRGVKATEFHCARGEFAQPARDDMDSCYGRDRQGNLWFNNMQGQLVRVDAETGVAQHIRFESLQPHRLNQGAIDQLFRDRSGQVWVWATGTGLCRFDPSDWVQHHALGGDLEPNPVPTTVRAIYGTEIEGEEEIWLAAVNGLLKWNRHRGEVRMWQHDENDPDGLGNSSVRAIARKGTDDLWIGTGSGLNYFDRKLDRLLRYYPSGGAHKIFIKGRFNAVREDLQGRLWTTDWKSLLRIDLEQEQVHVFRNAPDDPKSLLQGIPNSLVEDADGELWIGFNQGGLSRYLEGDDSFEHYHHDPANEHSLAHANVRFIHQDTRRRWLWIGTRAGLNRFDLDSRKLRRVATSAGVIADSIEGIVEGDGNELWLSLPNGLLRIEDRFAERPDSMLLTSAGGHDLANLARGVHKTRDGKLLFGGRIGVFEIDPTSFKAPALPPVVVTAFEHTAADGSGETVTDQLVSTKLEKVLSHAESKVVTLEFAALDFGDVARNQFSYKLDGFEENWRPALGDRHATYTTLPAGNYTFRVKARNANGVWSDEDATLRMIILPPWWATAWFRGIVLASIGAGLFALSQWRTRSIRKRNAELKEEIEQREEAEIAMRLSDERFQAFLQHSTDVIWCMELDPPLPLRLSEDEQVEYIYKHAHLVEANDAYARFTGHDSPAEMIGMTTQDIMPREIPENVQAVREMVRCRYSMDEMITREPTVNGEIRIATNSMVPTVENDEVVRIWGTGRDITARELAREKLESTEEELQEQRAVLTRAGRLATMGELTAAFAHELNQPLAAILRNAQAAQRFLDASDPDLGELREILADIVSDDKRAGNVLNRIRKLVSRSQDVHEDVDINEVILETLTLIRSDFILKHVTVDSQLSEDLPLINADRVQLQQVLINLLVNAGDALQECEVEFPKATITSEAIDGVVRVCVVDNGPGIAEQDLGQLFQAFFSTKAAGMGMGLAITRTIIDAHDGRIWAENAEAGGARIGFELPLKSSDSSK